MKRSAWDKVVWFMGVLVFMMILSAGPIIAFTDTAKLSWTPPTTFVGGAPLNPATDLSGFRVYQGTASGVYGAPIVVSNPTATTITLTIPSGVTYFAVSAVSSVANGSLEGAKSNEVSKVVSAPAPGGCTLTVQ